MIPNFVFTDEVGKIVQTAKNTDLTNHYSTWKQRGEDNKIDGRNLYDIECPDIYAGEIENKTVLETFFNPNTRENNKDKLDPSRNADVYKTIVIVLESPHNCEYDNFINPALGTTGINLNNHFKNLIAEVNKRDNILTDDKYRIVIMESISYQCSLGLPLKNDTAYKSIRDFVFKTIWNLQNKYGEFPTKKDFSSRLESYKPDVILNLCTTPSNKLVQEEIVQYQNQYPNVKLYIGYHPSSWHIYVKEKDTYIDEYQKIWKPGEKYSNPITF